jgi:hypothetical protein
VRRSSLPELGRHGQLGADSYRDHLVKERHGDEAGSKLAVSVNQALTD